MDISDLIQGQAQSTIDENEITTSLSSLYVKKKSREIVLYSGEEDQKKYGIPAELPSEVQFDTYTLYLSEFGHEGSEQNVVLEKLRRAEPSSELTTRIDSPGGLLNEGVKLYGVVKDNFKGRHTTVLDAMAYSMGALMFCTGDKRVAYEDSSLMFHDFSGGEYGKGGEMKDSLEHSIKFINKFFYKLTVKQGFLNDSEFKRMVEDSKQWWFDAEEMCYRGIATHVNVDGYELAAEQYIDYLAYDCPIEEFMETLNEEEAITDEQIASLLEALGLEVEFTEED